MKSLDEKSILFAGVFCYFLTPGCRDETSFQRPTPSLERMLEQPRWDAFESRPDSNQPARLLPPQGTVPFAFGGAPSLDAKPTRSLSPALDAQAMQEAKRWYLVYCAPCHGIDGDGRTTVSRLMPHPPGPLFAKPTPIAPGELYRVISEGTGKMPALQAQMTSQERWRVVAYVKSLEEKQPDRTNPPEEGASSVNERGGSP